MPNEQTTKNTIPTVYDIPRIGNFILFYGKMREGKTLAAVRFIKDILDENKNVKVISNIRLKNFPYKPFNRKGFKKYKNKLVFLDMIDFAGEFIPTRGEKTNTEEKLTKFFSNGNSLIATMIEPQMLYPAAKKRITLALECSMPNLNTIRLDDHTNQRAYLIRDIQQYFGLYDTRQIPNWKGIK